MIAPVYRGLLVSALMTTLLLTGCSREVEPVKSKQASVSVSQQDSNGSSSMTLSEAAMAVPTSSNTQQAVPAQQLLKQYAGSYTGSMPCVAGSGSCVKGDMNVTLTLFADGTALRTVSQQGADNAMLERETADWYVKRDGKTLVLILPSHHQLAFELLPAHKLRFDHAELANEQQVQSMLLDDDPILNTLDDADMHEDRYMLTMK